MRAGPSIQRRLHRFINGDLQAIAKRAEADEERREEARLKTEQQTLRRKYEEEHVVVAAEAKAAAVRTTVLYPHVFANCRLSGGLLHRCSHLSCMRAAHLRLW